MSPPRSQFQVGGAVPAGAIYVERRADRELLEALRAGEFCYILAPRQIGKSSLRIRVAQALARGGVRCVSIDLTSIGSNSVTIDEWYYSIADDIAQALSLPNLDLFWTTHQHLTPVHRWIRFIRGELLDQVAEPIVIFIDEVDSVLALSFATDDFFASIRSAYNLRAEDPAYARLTFCLLGVAAPADLIQNPVRTPFNIGREIRLDDFSRAELGAFMPGLEGLGCDPTVLLDAVYAWTSGHPYMTQRLCDDLTRHGPVGPDQEGPRVDDAAYNLFVRSGRGGDANLAYAEKRLDMNPSRVRVRQLLHLYRCLLDGERVPAEPNNPLQTELRLTGLAAEHLGAGGEIHLRTRNLIFAEVYDHKWLKAKEKEQRLAELVDRWTGSGKLDDYLLRGAALEDALEWSQGRSDLTVSDHEFLLAGVNYARREAEARHRVEEAARKEEAMRRTALEEQRKADRERYRADIERERRERAEEGAQSQRRTISILTGTVAALGLLLAMFVWQYIIAEQSKTQLAELSARNQEEADLQRIGAEALLLAQQSGKEREALLKAIKAAGSSIQKGRPVPPRVMQGLAAAVATPVQRPNVLRHGDQITVASFSHDGTRVMTASRDHSVHLWDAVSGRPIRTLTDHTGAVVDAAFSLDDTRIFSVSADRTARLWNAASGDLLETHKGLVTPQPGRFAAAMSPDGTRALLALADRSLKLADLRTGKPIDVLRGHTGVVTAASFSPDGLALVTACSDGSARLWAADAGKLKAVLRRHTGSLRAATFSPTGTRLITIGEDRTARLWNELGTHIAALTVHTEPILGAVFSPDGSAVVTHAADDTAVLWSAQTGRELATLVGHTGDVLDASFSADGRRVVTAGADDTAKVWQTAGTRVADLVGHTGPVRMARFSPDGSRVLTASDDTTARLWNSGSGNVVATLEGHTDRVRAGSFSPDGGHVVTIGDDNSARLWDASLSNAIPTLKGHAAPVRLARFSPDGGRIVTVSDDKTARLWDSIHYNLVRVLEGHTGPVFAAVFAGDGSGRLLTLAEDDATVRLWDSATGDPLAAVSHAGAVLAAAFSRDGRRIVTAGADDTLRQWDAETGAPIGAPCQGMRGGLDIAALAPGGAYALTATRENNRATLTAEGCVVIADLVGHSGPITGAAFSPDGEIVATISSDNTTKLWSTRYGNDLDTLDTGSGAVHSVVFARSGTRLVVATARDAWVYALVDEGTKTRLLATLQGHSAAVLYAGFSADSRRIVTASSDNTAKLWDESAPGYELIATLHGHSAAVGSADFSPDGRLVVTASRDSGAKVYPTTLEAFFKKACEALRSHPEDYDQVAAECTD
jgi:WD40 repeat protein